jgi:hypothetical protein
LAADDFTVVGDTCVARKPPVVAPGASCTVSVVFRPRAVGSRHAGLVIHAQVPGQPPFTVMVDLHGTAPSPSIELSPAVAHPRSVVQVIGKNWPPSATVAVSLAPQSVGTPGVAQKSFTLDGTVTEPDAQQFPLDATLIVYPRAQVGTRFFMASTFTADVEGSFVRAPFPVTLLVQSPTVNPPTVGGNFDLLLRNG